MPRQRRCKDACNFPSGHIERPRIGVWEDLLLHQCGPQKLAFYREIFFYVQDLFLIKFGLNFISLYKYIHITTKLQALK